MSYLKTYLIWFVAMLLMMVVVKQLSRALKEQHETVLCEILQRGNMHLTVANRALTAFKVEPSLDKIVTVVSEMELCAEALYICGFTEDYLELKREIRWAKANSGYFGEKYTKYRKFAEIEK